MPKRYCSTEIWEEDWFLALPKDYKLFWHYMLANCNHAGLFKVNLRSFCALNEAVIDAEEARKLFNEGKDRIRVLTPTLWLIEDFFVFQYGPTFNENNRVHSSIKKEYEKVGVKLGSIRGLKEVKDRVKDKDIDIDTTNSNEVSLTIEEVVKRLGEFDEVREAGKNLQEVYAMIVLRMIEVFRRHNPEYFFDQNTDYHAALQIAYRIAAMKHWKRDSVLNGNLQPCVDSWETIVLYIKQDKWFSGRSLTDIATVKEWQRLVQQMTKAKNEGNKQPGKTASTVGRDFIPD